MEISYWIHKNILKLKDIKKLNKFILNNYSDLEPDLYKGKNLKEEIVKNTTTYRIEYSKIKKYISNIVEYSYQVNSEMFGYDLHSLNDRVLCLFNVYDSKTNGNYDWHVDKSMLPFTDIKLTLLINLSEKEYEGGDFYLQDGNTYEIFDFKKPGSLLMFKSYMRHTVKPVTKGIRKSLTIFLNGPKLR